MSVELFLQSVRSERTKTSYLQWLKFYGLDKLSLDPLVAQTNLINFIIECKKKGMSYSAIHNYVAAVESYYQINDVFLNIKKINRFMPENIKVKKDKAYTHADIGKMLEVADLRARATILILASSGCRIGAIPFLKLRNLQDTKLTIYEGSKEEYFTFISPECKVSIDSYLDMRSRYGEKLKDNSPLIRDEFNTRKLMGKAKPLKREGLRAVLDIAGKKAGVRRIREISLAHGFRKFFTTQCINADINPEIREMLLGHKIGLAGCYYRPSEQEMFDEYQKAVDNLTIDESNKLRKKVEALTIDESRLDRMERIVKRLERLNRGVS